eukprot:5116179-Amphidinium_carterae.1
MSFCLLPYCVAIVREVVGHLSDVHTGSKLFDAICMLGTSRPANCGWRCTRKLVGVCGTIDGSTASAERPPVLQPRISSERAFRT